MLKSRYLITVLSMTTILSGCGARPQSENFGAYQDVLIKTDNGVNASCSVENASTSFNAFYTPAHISLPRASSPVTIKCKSSEGWVGSVRVESDLDGKAVIVAGAVAVAATGAIMMTQPHVAALGISHTLAAGMIAGGVSAGALTFGSEALYGDAFKYPEEITIPMNYQGDIVGPDSHGFPITQPTVVKPPVYHRVVHHIHKIVPVKPDCLCKSEEKKPNPS